MASRIHELPPLPLCGYGEASSQHLCLWCPAAALAWALVTGLRITTILADLSRFRDGAAGPGCSLPGLAAALGHQITFLYGSLASRSKMEWRAAGTRLAQAVGSSIKWPLDDPALLRFDALPVD